MHLTTAVMKNGKTISGYIKRMRPKEGFILLDDANGDEIKILLKEAKSIITEGERISIANRYANEDELARMRELGWDGIK